MSYYKKYDERMPWGLGLVVLGVSIFLASLVIANRDEGDPDPVHLSELLWGTGIGGFLILLGVILIAGAKKE